MFSTASRTRAHRESQGGLLLTLGSMTMRSCRQHATSRIYGGNEVATIRTNDIRSKTRGYERLLGHTSPTESGGFIQRTKTKAISVTFTSNRRLGLLAHQPSSFSKPPKTGMLPNMRGHRIRNASSSDRLRAPIEHCDGPGPRRHTDIVRPAQSHFLPSTNRRRRRKRGSPPRASILQKARMGH